MDPLNILKANFAVNLEKQGSSLLELEDALANMDKTASAEKAAELLKLAFLDKLDPMGMASGVAGGAGKLYGLGVASGGFLGGNALDTADKSVDADNEKLRNLKDKVKLLRKLTQKVQQENM